MGYKAMYFLKDMKPKGRTVGRKARASRQKARIASRFAARLEGRLQKAAERPTRSGTSIEAASRRLRTRAKGLYDIRST